MTDEYITREDAMWAACKALCHPGARCPDNCCIEVRKVFNAIPAADVAPVVHGEYIERKAAIALADGGCHPANVATEIAKLPAADVAPVVFCKDCKSCNTNIDVGGWYGMCAFWNGHSVMADDYCSRFQNKDSADMREVQGG